jgi:hypothetical protein
MGASKEHVDYALDLVKYLPPPEGIGTLFEAALDACHIQDFDASTKWCCELYDFGLEQGNTYIQGLAQFCLGSVHFALGTPNSNWNRAAGYFARSAKLFHTAFDANSNRNEGIAELALGRLREQQCLVTKSDKWREAISAYEKAKEFFSEKPDSLFSLAEDSLERVMASFIEHGQKTSGADTPSNQSHENNATGQTETTGDHNNGDNSNNAGGSGCGNGNNGTPLTPPPRGPRGNYAITVVCQQAPSKRTRKFSTRILILLVLGILGITELGIALLILREMMAQLVILAMFLVTVLLTLVLLIIWYFRFKIPSGSVGILLKDGSNPTLTEGTIWQLPLLSELYDIISLGQHEYKCRMEFRERESSAPVIIQEIRVQYHVTQAELNHVINQLPILEEQPKPKHPITQYWEDQMGDHIKRYFEDQLPSEIKQTLENSRLHESNIFDMLCTSANKHSWGINFFDKEEDVHLGHYRIEKD